MVAPGVRGTVKSEAAIMAATTKATVVKKPKAVCRRLKELYMLGERQSPGGGDRVDNGEKGSLFSDNFLSSGVRSSILDMNCCVNKSSSMAVFGQTVSP